ncbi:Conserved oligomeric Golgi complex, subunit 3 [Penicillium expansum]|uniref:Conserved oligomeric Golgi complex subunit 3 n=1 Tax=Penicillium expansum TaxID=27334 RepID=A0A0A2IUA1_PENEN|nr:Conserved oligomeric Golgi complex, subunit 3 [Penicillium expansum]KGO36938.1 Conserved oligomeric Golgi complex, subunit 3 [Penicillium expansum]KGO43740.1 Conserved oligomeric Golgi complex, subunit 3 [Penicillium expansum]KGO51397.1 Conserved oligomeric Golgi complex, subunit 3 [Penicillium expansum]
MPSTKQQRARRQTAPSGPPRKPTAKETESSLQALDEKSPSGFEWKTPGWSNELEFSQWLNSVKGDLIEESYDEYQNCLDELEQSKEHIDEILTNTLTLLEDLSSLSESFKSVETQTSNFEKQCQGLLSAQERDTKLANGIRNNLQYYDFLDPASRRLNAPGAGNTVRDKEFSDMLRHLDVCLDYMETHPDQKDAEVYRSRYRLLLTRALTLIRGNFVSSLKDIYQNVSKKISDQQLNDTALSALLYAKFRVGAPELKQIGVEIQKRAVPPLNPDQNNEAEYQSLMNELHSNYSATRGKLIIPLARKKLGEITQTPSSSKDLVAFARASISYIRGLCLDEYDLWGEWFHGEGGLYDFLETVCEPLYDHLRPRIIHESDIVKLCQLCNLLQTRYFSDPEEEQEQVETNHLDFSVLIQPALQDVQARLVFRALAVLRDEIERYKPRPEDTDYPMRNRQVSLTVSDTQISGKKDTSADTLIDMTAKQGDDAGESTQESDGKWDFETQTALKGWYPTLRKAIWLLSRIYRLVNSTVFDDLAHQIVHQTTLSLQNASTLISAKATPADSQLFLMSHLLILKQQIVAFDIEYVSADISFDFSGMTSTFWELRERGGLFNPRNLMRLVGHGLIPRVVENMLDAKVELDGRLRTVINDFINAFAARMTASLPAQFVDSRNLARGELILPSCRTIEKEVPVLRKVLNEYIDDTRMKETLVGAVQDRTIQIYEDFFEKYTSSEKAKGNFVSKKGKGRDDAVWDVNTFAEWCEGVFRVGVAGLQADIPEDDDDILSTNS